MSTDKSTTVPSPALPQVCAIPHRTCDNCKASLIYCGCPSLHVPEIVAACGICTVSGGWPLTVEPESMTLDTLRVWNLRAWLRLTREG